MRQELLRALRALVGQVAPGPMSARLETAIDAETDRVLKALAAELAAGGGKASTKRSAAARVLLKKGAEAMLAETRS